MGLHMRLYCAKACIEVALLVSKIRDAARYLLINDGTMIVVQPSAGFYLELQNAEMNPSQTLLLLHA